MRKHGIVARVRDPRQGYFGWPSAARTQSGRIVAVSSGLRRRHIDPWGKTVISVSDDGGETFRPPRVIHNSPLDDRDAGIVSLGGESLLVTWFTVDVNQYDEYIHNVLPEDEYREARAVMDAFTPEIVNRYKGSWTMRSHDGGETWDEPTRSPLSAPHAPIRLSDGRLLYLGKGFPEDAGTVCGEVFAAESFDEGKTWTRLGTVAPTEDVLGRDMHEPHAVELPDGSIFGVVRVEAAYGANCFRTWGVRSFDKGRTWTKMRDLGVEGSPAHLLLHSSGALIMTVGYRKPPYGQRARVSLDGGETFGPEIILRDDGPTGDLGYPCTVELPDQSLFTVYYQAYGSDAQDSVLSTHWTLEE